MRKSDWNSFWDRAGGGRFTSVSWSKRRIEEVLDPFLGEGVRVLDAGCGSGYFCGLFLSKGCRVSALDSSEEALGIARRATRNRCEEYLAEDLLDRSFSRRHAGRFDLVFTDGLFEHFVENEQETIMENLTGALRPGGTMATFVPNLFSWWTAARPLFMKGIHEKPFRRKKLIALHRSLEVIRMGGISVVPFRFSPERLLAARFGMLLYVLARKGAGASRT